MLIHWTCTKATKPVLITNNVQQKHRENMIHTVDSYVVIGERIIQGWERSTHLIISRELPLHM